jgi:hypothetical protein
VPNCDIPVQWTLLEEYCLVGCDIIESRRYLAVF